MSDETENTREKRKYNTSKKRHKKRGKYKRRTDKFGEDKVGKTCRKKHKKYKARKVTDEALDKQEVALKKYMKLRKTFIDSKNTTKLPFTGSAGYYRNVNPMLYNDAVIRTIAIMRKVTKSDGEGSITFAEAAAELTKLRMDEKEPFAIERVKIDRLPLRMKRLLATKVMFCLMHPRRFNRLTDSIKSDLIFTYANMDLYYYFNNRYKMLFFRRPFKCNITLHLSDSSYAPIGEYSYMMQKVLLACFCLLDIVPDSPCNSVAKYYFAEFNVKLGSCIERRGEYLGYDLELEELTQAEYKVYLKDHMYADQIRSYATAFNRRKRGSSYKARNLRMTKDMLGYHDAK